MHFRITVNFLLAILLTSGFSGGIFASPFIDNSLEKANDYLNQGQYYLALQEADNVLKNTRLQAQKSLAYGVKGNTLLTMQRFTEAEEALLQAYELSGERKRKAGFANSLGVLYLKIKDKTKSETFFKLAAESVENDPVLALKIKLNQMHVQPQNADLSKIEKVLSEIAGIDSTDERIRYYLNLASIVKMHALPFRVDVIRHALESAYADSAGIVDKPLYIEVLDSLAEYYESQGRNQEALKLSELASSLAEGINVEDLAIQVEGRKARIYQQQGQDIKALAAFRKAVDYVQAIRMDIPVSYENGESSYRKTLEPIYLGYAHQLLKKARDQHGEAKQHTLLLALQAIESIRKYELEDFLGGRCLVEGMQRNVLYDMDTQAAILYPIILVDEDQLELLVSIGKTIRHFSVSISKTLFHETVNKLNCRLRRAPGTEADPYCNKVDPPTGGEPVPYDPHAYQKPAQDIYQWVISLVESDLEKESIKTLVIIPDGIMRLIPFAALFDGNKHLIEKYAISISPGMSLLGSKDKPNKHIYQVLLAGISKPGPDVDKIIVNNKLQNMRDSLNSPLPGVETELLNLKERFKSTLLFNDKFTVNNFYQHISKQSFDIIHIATHGFFSSDSGENFLMAYDDIVKLDDLQGVLSKSKSSRGGIQLLTFSACNTAEGDDRAPLGFTGAALRANAQSALGSLWPADDNAASQLMISFYKNLLRFPGKAEALRQAQLELLKSDLNHPFFWSPFILVGNWL